MNVDWEVRQLYRAMPGAPKVEEEGWSELWEKVIGNEHWMFCLGIVLLIKDSISEASVNARLD